MTGRVDRATAWYLIIGFLSLSMAFGRWKLEPAPISRSLLYLIAGVLLGPHALELLPEHILDDFALFERVAEIGVITSLFTAGLKLRLPLADHRWRPALWLAFGAMTLTVGLIALTASFVLALPLGAGVLLGAILAPTDPVLASDVQLRDPQDRDRLRFSLTGEAGLNDGTAFPFVMLGLGLLGVHEIGTAGWRWALRDLLWAVTAGLGCGYVVGWSALKAMEWLQRRKPEFEVLTDFLALGMIATSYGLALWIHSYGFLSVFAAALALRRAVTTEKCLGGETDGDIRCSIGAALKFNEQIERLLEVALVLFAGFGLSVYGVDVRHVVFALALLFLIRPLAVLPGLWSARLFTRDKAMIAWFGIRGIGSVYYLMFAIEHGVPVEYRGELLSLTFTTIAASIILHGISVTPLMRRLNR